MMKCYLSLILSLFLSMSAMAQWTLKGVVLDEETHESLIGANISFCEHLTTSNLNGYFEMHIPNDQSCDLLVSYIGYETFKVSLKSGNTFSDTILLSHSKVILETAVVTGTKYAQSISESTVSIEVISPDFIQAQGKNSIEDVIDRVPGVQIIDNQANIRGGSGWSYGAGSRVMLLLDDIPILQPDAGFPNWNDLPIENIGQVEILKGASSALYGSSAMNGIINIKTQYAKSKPETEIGLNYTQFLSPRNEIDKSWGDTIKYEYSLSFAHRQKLGKLDVVAGAFVFDRKSFRENTFSKYQRGNIRLRYRWNDRLNIGLFTNVNSGKSASYFYWKDKASYLGSSAAGITNSEKLRYNIDPFLTYLDKYGNQHKLTGRLYRMDNNNSENQSTKAVLNYIEYQWHRKLQFLDAVVSAGVVNSDSKISAELYGDTTFYAKNVAAYVQLDKKLWSKLNLSFGVRYEYNSVTFPSEVFGDTVYNGRIKDGLPVFRFGANYPLGQATFLRASWGQGYRFPTLAEQFINTNAGLIFVVPNIDLTSETGASWELGLKQGYKWAAMTGYFDAGLFWSEYDNMMEFGAVVANGRLAFQSQNIGGTTISGIDLSTAGHISFNHSEISFLLGYTYIDPKFKDFDSSGFNRLILDPNLTPGQRNAAKSTLSENVLKYRSRHQIKSDFQYTMGGAFLGANYNFSSNMLAIDKAFEVIIPGVKEFRQDYKGYGILDLRVGYNFQYWRLAFYLNNAMNTIYSVRPGLLEAPRNASLRFSFTI